MRVKFLTNAPLDFGDRTISFSHRAGGPDLSLVDKGQVKFFANHRYGIEHQLGDVSRGTHDDTASYADIDLYNFDDPLINKAKHLLTEEGHKGLSAGIRRHSAPRRVRNRQYEVDKWQLGEISLTGIPRDTDTETNLSVNSGGPALVCMGELDGVAIPITLHFMDGFTLDAEQEDRELMTTPKLEDTSLLDVIGGLGDTIRNSVTEGVMAAEQAKQNAEAKIKAEAEAAQRLADLEAREKALAEREQVLRLHEEKESEEKPDETSEGEDDEEKAEEEDSEDMEKQNWQAIERMLSIATSMPDQYKAQELMELGLEAAEGNLGLDDFKEKLRSVQINPKPLAPNEDNPMGDYKLERVLQSLVLGRDSVAPAEIEVSNQILLHGSVGLAAPGTIAIPTSMIDEQLPKQLDSQMQAQLATQIASGGTDNIDGGYPNPYYEYYRSDIPDPFNVVPLVTQLPGGPGNPNFVAISVPKPAMVAEPGDTGYAKTGDSSTAETNLTPLVLVVKTAMTRLVSAQAPNYLSQVLAILLDRMQEVQTEQILTGSGASNQAAGLYGLTGVSNTDLSGAVLTPDVCDAALRSSWQYASDPTRRIVISPTNYDVIRKTAEVTGISPYVVNQAVRGTPIALTEAMATGSKPERGMVGPFSEVRMKRWDNSVFVSRRREDGVDWLVAELFWNFNIRRPALFHRFQED